MTKVAHKRGFGLLEEDSPMFAAPPATCGMAAAAAAGAVGGGAVWGSPSSSFATSGEAAWTSRLTASLSPSLRAPLAALSTSPYVNMSNRMQQSPGVGMSGCLGKPVFSTDLDPRPRKRICVRMDTGSDGEHDDGADAVTTSQHEGQLYAAAAAGGGRRVGEQEGASSTTLPHRATAVSSSTASTARTASSRPRRHSPMMDDDDDDDEHAASGSVRTRRQPSSSSPSVCGVCGAVQSGASATSSNVRLYTEEEHQAGVEEAVRLRECELEDELKRRLNEQFLEFHRFFEDYVSQQLRRRECSYIS